MENCAARILAPSKYDGKNLRSDIIDRISKWFFITKNRKENINLIIDGDNKINCARLLRFEYLNW